MSKKTTKVGVKLSKPSAAPAAAAAAPTLGYFHDELMLQLFPNSKNRSPTKIERFYADDSRAKRMDAKKEAVGQWSDGNTTVYTTAGAVGQYACCGRSGTHEDWYWMKHPKQGDIAIRIVWSDILKHHIDNKGELVVNDVNTNTIPIQERK